MSESRFVCKIVAKAESDAAEIMVYDDIGASWFGEGVTAKQFLRDLSALDASNITVRINSAGGDVFEGLAIHNAIKRHKANVVVEIDALAASIASIIALAGDEVRMSDNAFFMIHDPSGLNHGTAEDMRAMADLLDKVGGSLANVYAEKTGMDVEEIQALMRAETWFDASEAKDMGFVDVVTKGKKMAARADISAFSNTPKALRAAILAAEPEPTPAPVGGTEPVDSLPPTQPAPEAKGEPVENNTAAHQTGVEDIKAALAADRKRGQDIRAIAEQYDVPTAKIEEWVVDGKTLEEVNGLVLASIKAKAAAAPIVTARVGAPRAESDPRAGFESHRDFLLAVMKNSRAQAREQVKDERLQMLTTTDADDNGAEALAYMLPRAFAPKDIRAAAGSDEQGNYADTYGGFLKPTQVLPGLLSVEFEGDPTAGLTRMLPMSAPVVKINARTDKNHTTSVSGGLTFTRTPETAAATSSRMAIEQITMEASPLVGAAYATEQIMTDSPISFAALLAAGFNAQRGAHILNEKIRGLGGNEYLGVLNSPAKVEISKETSQAADTIVYDNVLNMRARSWGYNSAVWVANHDCLPQIAKMSLAVGTGGAPVYVPGSFGGRPDSLLGRPIMYSEYMNTVGDAGDIALVNWGEYLEGVYQPMRQDESIHVRFLNLERTFRFYERNCGAPWWRSALTPAKGSNTLSPIVTLAARA